MLLEALTGFDDDRELTVEHIQEVSNDYPLWKAAFASRKGLLNKVLRSNAFKDPGMKDDEIRPFYLSTFALVNCIGKPEEKAIALYYLI